MQVFCRSTNGNSEVQCCVCGQGFVMFWDRQSRAERAAARREIQEILRNHHRNHPGAAVHPTGGFLVPEWGGPIDCSAADTLGHAPSWEL